MRESIRIAVPEIGQDMHNYVAAIRGVGMEPVIISRMQDNAEGPRQREYLCIEDFQPENYCGLLIPGGVDINPRQYGEKNTDSRDVNDALDELQLMTLGRSIRAGIPILGICRGMQVINVYFGGTMIQHLPTAQNHAWNLEKRADRVHESHANHGSWLSRLYGTTYMHNSAHHQGVGRLGVGLVIDSRSTEDGVVEAIHHEKYPIIGVQWHPERMSFANRRPDTVDGKLIWEYFREMCSHHSREDTNAEESGAML